MNMTNAQIIFNEAVGFRPQQGLPIMNQIGITTIVMKMFPSPTGVTYYEFMNLSEKKIFEKLFPSPTGVTYYELKLVLKLQHYNLQVFPSPTGVTYYESGNC